MKAVVYSRYGPPEVLRIEERPDPSPGPDEVLVSVHAAAVNPYDWHFVRGVPYLVRLFSGLRTPKREGVGLDFAGRVEAVGDAVTRFARGDEVYGMANGAFAELVCASEEHLSRKPKNLDFASAAAVPLAATTALQGLRDAGRLEAGERVLIVGASGGAGTFAVQLAKQMNAHVTGVCSTAKLELVRSLGADEVVDYTQGDFTASGGSYDLVFELGGDRSPLRLRRLLTRRGRLVLSSGDSTGRWIGPIGRLVVATFASPFVSQTLVSLGVRRRREDLEHFTELLEAGRLTVVVERTYPLTEIAAALAHVETGHTRGKVVVSV